jgi:integrase
VKRPKAAKPEHELWSDKETRSFEKAAADDRLHPVITLQCLGLRPEEVCGLKWRRDVKLVKRELAINIARTLVDGKPIEKPPKTKAGERTLPLDDALAAALTAFPGIAGSRETGSG